MPDALETHHGQPPMTSPPDQPAYRPFPEVAQAMRAHSGRILDEWRARTLLSMPDLGELTVKEFENDIARILSAMADALESNDPPDLQRLVEVAPAHGFQRFLQEYDLADLFAEERVLRRVIVSQVELALQRQCKPDEAASLHTMIDIMLQQGVLALVQQQKKELRQVTEVQLKYLSFLSHDLSNNFLMITMNLEHLEGLLASAPEMEESAEVIAASLALLRRTQDGMRRLLQHERLRSTNDHPGAAQVNLREVVEPIVTLAASRARGEGIRVLMDIEPRATAETNADLLTILLQNLIGNAVKHSAAKPGAGGTVRIEAARLQEHARECWNLSVVDDGPGIPRAQLDRLFNAFEQIPKPGAKAFDDERGFGLGLAIASQAARLLGTQIKVETPAAGKGCRFSISLPAALPAAE